MSDNIKERKVWLIGCGAIGIAYAKVLTALGADYIVVGRGEENAMVFERETGQGVIRGGLEAFLQRQPSLPQAVIIAVNVDALASTAIQLINYGIKQLLIEKPGVCEYSEIVQLESLAKKENCVVRLAYNRRFYSSVFLAERIIADDGGVKSFHFEFTEWSHTIKNLPKPKAILENWFIANSSHVIDTAFFLGGRPNELSSFHMGGTDWHPSSSIFAGAGISDKGALFSYQANWEAPGRWAIEILTVKHRLYLKPMEKLFIQNLGSLDIQSVPALDDELDTKFKPGFFQQTKAFLEGDFTRFCTIAEQKENIYKFYVKMSGYDRKPIS